MKRWVGPRNKGGRQGQRVHLLSRQHPKDGDLGEEALDLLDARFYGRGRLDDGEVGTEAILTLEHLHVAGREPRLPTGWPLVARTGHPRGPSSHGPSPNLRPRSSMLGTGCGQWGTALLAGEAEALPKHDLSGRRGQESELWEGMSHLAHDSPLGIAEHPLPRLL